MVQTDGEVILLQSLDYETQREYQLTVMATVCYIMYIYTDNVFIHTYV